MRCLLCEAVIDETLSVPPVEGPGGKLIEDVAGKARIARTLEKWSCVAIVGMLPAGATTLYSGYVCEKHDLGALALVETKSTAAKPQSSKQP